MYGYSCDSGDLPRLRMTVPDVHACAFQCQCDEGNINKGGEWPCCAPQATPLTHASGRGHDEAMELLRDAMAQIEATREKVGH